MNEENKENKDSNRLNLYKEIVDRAHREIEQVRSVYKWLASLIAIIMVFGIYYTFRSASEFKEEIRKDIKELKIEVTKRVDRELASDSIQALINNRVKTHIDKNAKSIIENQIKISVNPIFEEADAKLKEISKRFENMKIRQSITQLADKAIVESSREAFDEILKVSEKNEEGTPLRLAADAEKFRVFNFWSTMRKEKGNIPLKKPDGTTAKESDYTTEELIEFLNDDKWDARMQAAEYLAKRKEEKSIKALIDSIKTEKDIVVLKEELRAFSKITEKEFTIVNYKKAIKYYNENKEKILQKVNR